MALSRLTEAATCPVCASPGESGGLELGGYPIQVCPVCSLRFVPRGCGATPDYEDVHATVEYQRNQVERLRTTAKNPRLVTGHATYSPFFRRFKPQAGNLLLDVGCGVGIFCLAARSLGWDTVGIDVAERAVSVGRGEYGLSLRALTLQDLIDEQKRFDVVTLFEVLEHLTDPLETLVQARKLLRERGTIFCTVPNWNCTEVQRPKHADWLPPIHMQFFTVDALFQLGCRAGLESIEVGVIRADCMGDDACSKLKWTARRILQRANPPLGLWIYGRIPDPTAKRN